MGVRDARVDAYIEKQRDFARPILVHLRDLVHATCPAVEEAIKWGSPFFMYHHAPLCQMAAFKEHAAFGFWKASLIEGLPPNANNGGSAAGNFGRLMSVKDLPSQKQLTGVITAAMKLNEDGTATPRPRKAPRPAPDVPVELVRALEKNRKAKDVFEKFPPGHRREYVEWITEAKREETRAKRVAQTVQWLTEGKSRHWKYQDC